MLFLYGPPGSGKSTIGKRLAEHQSMNHIDTDTIIESRHGKIGYIIARYGISYFREMETQVLIDIVDSQSVGNSVISLGGGTLLRRENLGIIQTIQSKIITFIGDTNILYQNIISDTDNHRPLAINQDIFAGLILERKSHYENFENKVSINGKSINKLVNETLSILSISLPEPRSP